MDRRRRLNAEFNRRAGRHARQASQGRCPGTPARCGRASSEPGTSGRRDARWQRAERRTIAAEVLASRFLRTVVTAALSSPVISRKPSRNRTVVLPVAGSQFNIAQFTKAILPTSSSAISRTYLQRKFAKKKDRAVFTGGPSQGGNARGRAAIVGTIARSILQMEKSSALTNLNLSRA
jgi:hypothetical protein